jgi:hypothetical protein
MQKVGEAMYKSSESKGEPPSSEDSSTSSEGDQQKEEEAVEGEIVGEEEN